MTTQSIQHPVSIGLLVVSPGVDAVILEGWPAEVCKPRIVVFDYAGDDVPDNDVLHCKSGAPNNGLTGSEVVAVEYRPECRYPSPAEVLSVLDASKEAQKPSALSIALNVHERTLQVDARLNRAEEVPTGDDYNRLFAIANDGLLNLAKALGHQSPNAAAVTDS